MPPSRGRGPGLVLGLGDREAILFLLQRPMGHIDLILTTDRLLLLVVMMNTRTGLIPGVFVQVKIRLFITGMMKIIVALAALHENFVCRLLVFFPSNCKNTILSSVI